MSGLREIIKQLKEEKDRREKERFRCSIFSRVNAMVKEYRLGKDFINRIDRFLLNPMIETVGVFPAKAKKNFDPPLFSLSDQEQYRTTMEIIKRVENPYLLYANSPDELILSLILYRINPSIKRDELEKFHFEMLLRREIQRGIIDK